MVQSFQTLLQRIEAIEVNNAELKNHISKLEAGNEPSNHCPIEPTNKNSRTSNIIGNALEENLSGTSTGYEEKMIILLTSQEKAVKAKLEALSRTMNDFQMNALSRLCEMEENLHRLRNDLDKQSEILRTFEISLNSTKFKGNTVISNSAKRPQSVLEINDLSQSNQSNRYNNLSEHSNESKRVDEDRHTKRDELSTKPKWLVDHPIRTNQCSVQANLYGQTKGITEAEIEELMRDGEFLYPESSTREMISRTKYLNKVMTLQRQIIKLRRQQNEKIDEDKQPETPSQFRYGPPKPPNHHRDEMVDLLEYRRVLDVLNSEVMKLQKLLNTASPSRNTPVPNPNRDGPARVNQKKSLEGSSLNKINKDEKGKGSQKNGYDEKDHLTPKVNSRDTLPHKLYGTPPKVEKTSSTTSHEKIRRQTDREKRQPSVTQVILTSNKNKIKKDKKDYTRHKDKHSEKMERTPGERITQSKITRNSQSRVQELSHHCQKDLSKNDSSHKATMDRIKEERFDMELTSIKKDKDIRINGIDFEQWQCIKSSPLKLYYKDIRSDPFALKVLVAPKSWLEMRTYQTTTYKDEDGNWIIKDARRSKLFDSWYDRYDSTLNISRSRMYGDEVEYVPKEEKTQEISYDKVNTKCGNNRNERGQFFVQTGASEGHLANQH